MRSMSLLCSAQRRPISIEVSKIQGIELIRMTSTAGSEALPRLKLGKSCEECMRKPLCNAFAGADPHVGIQVFCVLDVYQHHNRVPPGTNTVTLTSFLGANNWPRALV